MKTSAYSIIRQIQEKDATVERSGRDLFIYDRSGEWIGTATFADAAGAKLVEAELPHT